MTSIPAYDPNSNAFGQVDLRMHDLSGLDLRQSPSDLLYADFDTQTKWPAPDRLPPGFDWQKIMDLGKDPGLGVRSLHARGITGRGVGIAIIDQTLLVDHQEYKDQLRLYEEADDIAGAWLEAQMHGPAVASIAAGKTVGVAPEADLYYFATVVCSTGSVESMDYACLAKSVRRVLEVNRQLPNGRKIRVISMSIGWEPQSRGYAEIMAAVREARTAGLLVVSSKLEETFGLKFQAMGRAPLADPDQFDSYGPGLSWAREFYAGGEQVRRFYADSLWVPVDSRTTASPGGVSDYVFYRQGGWSWAIPYIAATYALAAQVKPSIAPEAFWKAALQTGRTVQLEHESQTIPFGPILDPVALITALEEGQ